jgi:hypothetical protein
MSPSFVSDSPLRRHCVSPIRIATAASVSESPSHVGGFVTASKPFPEGSRPCCPLDLPNLCAWM